MTKQSKLEISCASLDAADFPGMLKVEECSRKDPVKTDLQNYVQT